MVEPIPAYAQKTYAIIYKKHHNRIFTTKQLGAHLSRPMLKKTIYILKKNGWIESKSRGKYACRKPQEIIQELAEKTGEGT